MAALQAAHPTRIQSIVTGFKMPFAAMKWLLRTRGVKRFAVLPFLANFVLYSAAVFLGFYLVAHFELRVDPWVFWGPVGGWLSSTINFLSTWLKWLISIPLIFVTCYFTFTAVGMVIASPLNDILSDRIERKLCEPPQDPSLSFSLSAKIMLRSMFDSLVTVLKHFLALFLTLPFLLVPLVGFIPMLMVTAYFSGFGFFDIPLARHNLFGKHKKKVHARQCWEALGFGLAMEMFFYIPLVGLLMLPVGVTAGTMVYCRTNFEGLFEDGAPLGFAPPVLDGAMPDNQVLEDHSAQLP